MHTANVFEQDTSQATTAQYFSTFAPRGQFEEVLPTTSMSTQDVWQNTSDVFSILLKINCFSELLKQCNKSFCVSISVPINNLN